MAEHARQQTRRPALAARQGGAHRLLGVFVHQLPTRHPARRRLVPAYKDSGRGFEVIGVHTPSTHSRRSPATSKRAPPTWASPTRSRWTTVTPPGLTTATGIGPLST
ncbi:dipZ domain protein [Mycobacterium xenopi 3993]|nr:dipZ domain protein [Mycobacterium xenopi 3993]